DDLSGAFVPEEARATVLEHVGRWRGEAMGPSRAWVEDAILPVAEHVRPAARLALLVALASYQVDDEVVSSFRKQSPSDEALLGTVAWAAFTAARRVGTWLGGSYAARTAAHLAQGSFTQPGAATEHHDGRR